MIQSAITTNQDQNRRNLIHFNGRLTQRMFSFRCGTSFKAPAFYIIHLEVFNNMKVNLSSGSRETYSLI